MADATKGSCEAGDVEELARHYLSNSDLSGSQISYLLGFENPNSFFRAFHAWTGFTAESVRSQPVR